MPSSAARTPGGTISWPHARTAAAVAVALLALVAATVWAYRMVEQLTSQRAEERVQFAVNAEVAALDVWLDGEATLLLRIASQPDIRQEVLALLRRSGARRLTVPELLASSEAARLRVKLDPVLATHNFENFAVLDSTRRIIASSERELVGLNSSLYGAAAVQQLATRGAAIVPPFLLQERGSSRFRPVLLAAVAIREGPDTPVLGWLDVRLDARSRFESLLASGRFGRTGETFAFTRDAMLVSPSRFDEQLRRLRLLPADAAASLSLRLADPGADLLAGARARGDATAWPLTAMAASAVQGNDGVNVAGYRSYLGRQVVGAWRWLPRYEIGVAAEQSHAEAYAGLQIVWRAFLLLFGLLLAGVVGIVIGSRVLSRAERRARRAEHLGQYVLERRIADGAMGSVWRARHALLRRPTAIKVLAPGRTSATALARFEREALRTSQLTHPNTIAVFDFGRTPGGMFYLAMEYLVGLSLEQLVARHGPIPERRVVHLLKQILGSLAEAHRSGLVHRDIKPANIMLCHRGGIPDFVKVLDFGLVKDRVQIDPHLTMEGAAIGTPLYMAPEASAASGEVDARSDLYSLGCTAWFLLVGEPPFPGRVAHQVMRRHAEEGPPSLAGRAPFPVHPLLEDAIARCLAKDPRHRPQSASALAELLTAVVEPEIGVWSLEEAEAWWRTCEPDRIGIVAEAVADATGERLTVDLGQRGALREK